MKKKKEANKQCTKRDSRTNLFLDIFKNEIYQAEWFLLYAAQPNDNETL